MAPCLPCCPHTQQISVLPELQALLLCGTAKARSLVRAVPEQLGPARLPTEGQERCSAQGGTAAGMRQAHLGLGEPPELWCGRHGCCRPCHLSVRWAPGAQRAGLSHSFTARAELSYKPAQCVQWGIWAHMQGKSELTGQHGSWGCCSLFGGGQRALGLAR